MREKTLRFVVTFHTTADAMAMEKLCKKVGIEGKLISAPRAITADCGIAWRSELCEAEKIKHAIAASGLEVQGMHEVEL
ncbi:MAG: DUF3343 domain-containing protein [Phascolarctobacterium sp.]|nr:DUF3343 domain-containing protein [Phascolarctobacterium sp.]